MKRLIAEVDENGKIIIDTHELSALEIIGLSDLIRQCGKNGVDFNQSDYP